MWKKFVFILAVAADLEQTGLLPNLGTPRAALPDGTAKERAGSTAAGQRHGAPRPALYRGGEVPANALPQRPEQRREKRARPPAGVPGS